MNNKNKILVGCLALLLVLSVGYAIFSDTITINGTATAKGEFDITPTCEVVTSDNATTNETNVITTGGTGVCEVDGNTVTTTSTLSKPTDTVYYRTTYTNAGTIPAVLTTVDSSNNASHINSNGVIEAGDAMYANDYYLVAAYGTLHNDGSYHAIADSEAEALKLTLQPDEEITLYIRHEWSDSQWLEQPELPEEGSTINYNITAKFEQITN